MRNLSIENVTDAPLNKESVKVFQVLQKSSAEDTNISEA